MTKSIHFSQVPDMRGKVTMPFTDVTAENLRQKELARIHAGEMRDWEEDVYTEDEATLDAFLASDEYAEAVRDASDDDGVTVAAPAW